MSKKAAQAPEVGELHSLLTKVFKAVLNKYESQIEDSDPNPAMLSAVSKFLKDNEIMYDSSEINELSNQQRRINSLREARKGKIVSISDIPAVDNG